MALHTWPRRWPLLPEVGLDSTQPYETVFNVAFDTALPLFDHLSRNPDKMAEFAAYMRNV